MHPLSSFPLFLAVLPIYLIECHLGKRNLSCKWNFTLCFPPSTPPYHPGHSRLWWKPVVHVVGYRIHSDRWHTFFSFFTIICWFSKLEKKIQVTPTCIDLHLKYVAPNCSNDFQLGHFTYVDQWAEVGMGLSHNLKKYCKIPLTLLRFSPLPKEEHTPNRH